MKTKDLDFGNEGRKKLAIGAAKVEKAVACTLGAKGRNVILESHMGLPNITKDGVSVARTVFLDDPMENMGAQLLKEIAEKTLSASGDGTTTATILGNAIIQAGVKAIEEGSNPIDLKRGIERATKIVVDGLREQAISIEGDLDKMRQIALVSCNGDEKIATIIAETLMKVGKEGVVTAETGRTFETTVEVVEGLSFNSGYIAPQFINQMDKQECILNNPLILVHDGTISAFKDVQKIIENYVLRKRPILIIANDVEGEALSTLVYNRMENVFQVAVVRAPFMHNKRTEVLEDIAIITGGVVVSEQNGKKVETTQLGELGQADKVRITKNMTTIIGGAGTKDAIEDRKKIIRAQIDKESYNEHEEAHYKMRLAKMNNGVAQIFAGGQTLTEIKEKQDRIDDAIHATKAAVEEGVVVGGGVALVRTLNSLFEILPSSNKDERKGVEIIRDVVMAPLHRILQNAGVDKYEETALEIYSHDNRYYGYNARTEKMGDLFNAGIIDPVKVTRIAMENASSIGALLLTTEATIFLKDREMMQHNINNLMQR